MIGSSVPSAGGNIEKVQLIIEISHWQYQEPPYFATRRSPFAEQVRTEYSIIL